VDGLGRTPAVRDRPGESHPIFAWRVPARIGERPLTVTGKLDYVPPSDDRPSSGLIAAVVITSIGAALGFALMLRRRRRGEEAAAQGG
jgi:hypothetical protein